MSLSSPILTSSTFLAFPRALAVKSLTLANILPPVALANFSMSLLLTLLTASMPSFAKKCSAMSSMPFSQKTTLAPAFLTATTISLSIRSSSSKKSFIWSGLSMLIFASNSVFSISSFSLSNAIFAFSMYFGICELATSLSMTMPFTSSVSSKLLPCFLTTLIKSMSAL